MTPADAPAARPPHAERPHPVDVEDLRVRVHKALDDFMARQAQILDVVHPDCAPLAEYVADLIRGGKRLRPAFCYWAWRACGGEDTPQIATAAASLELFQAAALIHDDVMDDSDTRRGIPAVHRRFATLHRGAGWTGDGERFGAAGAILAGDLCLSWSDEMFAGSGLEPAVLARGRVTFDLMRTQLMGGQYLDMLEQAVAEQRRTGAAERARTVVRFKSAKYSVEHPLLIGARLAGADEETLVGLSRYGLPLGEAFQLRDDVLGVFGDPAQTGKPAGDDLREGKRTLLVARALEQASPAQAAAVRRLLGDPGLDATGVATLREILVETGALASVEALITELVDGSRAALTDIAALGAEPAAVAVLDDLVDVATARRA